MNKRKLYYVSITGLFIINTLMLLNFKRYIHILNLCFKKDIIISPLEYILILATMALILILMVVCIKLIIFNQKTEIKGINLKSEDRNIWNSKLVK